MSYKNYWERNVKVPAKYQGSNQDILTNKDQI